MKAVDGFSRQLAVALAFVACSAYMVGGFAGPLDRAVLHGETDKPRATDYARGEEMVFTLSLQGAEPFPADEYFIAWERTGDDGLTDCGLAPAETSLVIRTSMNQPGFVRILARVVDADGSECRRAFLGDQTTPEGRIAYNRFEHSDKRIFFDGGAGVEIASLQSVSEPEDFDAFWAKRKERLRKVPLEVKTREWPSEDPEVRVLSFSVSCAGPRPVTGHYTVPVKKGVYPVWIAFQGYGPSFVEKMPGKGPHDRIQAFINAHGYELGREDEYYKEFYDSVRSNGHSFGLDSDWQNKSTDTAYFGWMTYRIMRALEYLKSLPEWDGKCLKATGGSMGGLQALWAGSMDPDVTEVVAWVPWCCDMGGRMTCGRNFAGWGVGETEALRYFDPVNLVRRMNPKCRTLIDRAGLGDYCCPPSGVAILYNNIPGPKRITWVQGSTHGYVPSEKHQEFSFEKGW